MDRAVSHYLDGVTVKISEKYRPPRRITLPPGLIQLEPSDIFADDYECTLEEAALQMIFEKRQQREQQLIKWKNVLEEEEKMKEEILAAKNADKNLEKNDDNKQEMQTIQDFSKNGPPTDFHTFLQPTKSSLVTSPKEQIQTVQDFTTNGPPADFHTFLQPTKSSLVTSPKEQEKAQEPVRNFNLEDFEGYSTPFEDMALKTLNDKAELALVLQPSVPVEPSPSISQNYSVAYSNSSWSSVAYTPVQYSSGASWLPYATPSHMYTVNDNSLINSETVGSTTAPLRQAKSVPDLSEMATTPSATLAGTQQPRNITQNTKRLSSRTPPPRLISTNVNSVLKPLPNMALNLDPEQKRLFQQLTDMGFPRERVEAVLKKHGSDEKQILDYLLLVQTWEEKGFSPKAVELAITALGPEHISDPEKLEKHLQLHKQLLDLGFPEDRISSALVSAEHDRDKAIDILLQ